jgi:predicted dehydrogenase
VLFCKRLRRIILTQELGMTLRIGVVGAGVIGTLRARTIQDSPDTELVAVCDVVPAAAAAAVAGTGARAVGTLAEFLEIPMDAVIVSSPLHRHDEACLGALARGSHVLCEKPLANTVAGCARIVEAARSSGRVLAVGFNLRYFPAIKFVREVIASGRIGALDHLRLFGGHDGLHNFRAEWQYRAPESGGGAMMDIGIHLSDLARYFLGEITEVYGLMSERVLQVPGSEDNAVAVFRNQAGIPATYHATWTEWRGYGLGIEAYGSLGMVRGSYAPMQNLLITHDRPGGPRRTSRRFYPEIMVREKLRSWTSTTRLTFEEELRDFVARIGGASGGILADGHAGLRAVEVADAVRQSSQTREAVHLPALGAMP